MTSGKELFSGNRDHEFSTGWRFLLGSTVGIAGGFASLYFYSAGFFLRPLSAEFGWTRGEAALGAVAISVGNFFAIPLAGRMVDRFGAVRPALLSMMALSACFVLLATATQGLASFLALVLLLTATSSAANPVAFNRVVLVHFRRHRGLALGIALTGTGFGATLLPVFLLPYIGHHGWRAAYLVLALTVLPFALITAICLRGGDRRVVDAPKPEPMRDILSQRAFWSIAVLVFLAAASTLGTVYHLVAMLTDRGASPAEAGVVAASMGIAVIGGRVITGRLLDIANAGVVTAVLMSLAALGMLLLAIPHPVLLLPGAVLAGLGLGTESDLIAYLIGRRFSVRSFGSAYGAVFCAHVVGAGLGPTLAGMLFDRTGDYTAWFIVAAALLIAAAVVGFATERLQPPDPE